MTLLRVDGISKSFKGLRAVDEVSFEAAEGSILGVIGPNGAGKTTMFNLIAGALRPDSGRVHLDGKEITGHAPHKVTAAGMTRTFQLMRPFYSMTVLENVTIAVLAGGAGKRTARTAAAELIER
ncbi:MAG: ATP-binding cassette domain-containing protein, partial [Micromonospora sp.]